MLIPEWKCLLCNGQFRLLNDMNKSPFCFLRLDFHAWNCFANFLCILRHWITNLDISSLYVKLILLFSDFSCLFSVPECMLIICNDSYSSKSKVLEMALLELSLAFKILGLLCMRYGAVVSNANAIKNEV